MTQLTDEQLGRAEWANAVLDRMRDELGMRDLQVFREAGIDGPLCEYLHAIYNCPQQVLDFCHKKLTEHARMKTTS